LELPPQILKKILNPGTAFLFYQESFKSPKPHFFVVLNYNPQTDELLLMVNATTKVVDRRFEMGLTGVPDETLVVIKSGECSFLTRESAFDCNYPTLRTVEDLVLKYQKKVLKMVGEVSEEILSKLRYGVLQSPMVDDDTKKIIKIE
jgi:hypothetical protein